MCKSVCVCMLTDGVARDKKAKEEREQYVSPVCTRVSAWACHVVHVGMAECVCLMRWPW